MRVTALEFITLYRASQSVEGFFRGGSRSPLFGFLSTVSSDGISASGTRSAARSPESEITQRFARFWRCELSNGKNCKE